MNQYHYIINVKATGDRKHSVEWSTNKKELLASLREKFGRISIVTCVRSK